METKSIKIGTRKSRLAMAQTELVVRAIKNVCPEIQIEIMAQATTGDKILGKPLVEFGGKGVFVSEFEEAIAGGTMDLAVHSAKDLPACLADGLQILAVLPREDPRDVLVTVKGRPREACPMVIGTASLRRQAQIQERMDAECRLLRGNVNTRLARLSEGGYDGILLAAAGLKRLGLCEDEQFAFEYLPEREFIPAGGQGIIAVEGRADSAFAKLLQAVNDERAMRSFLAERAVLARLNAGCNEAVGVYSWLEDGAMRMKLMKETPDGIVRREVKGSPEDYLGLAEKLTQGL